MKFFIINLEIAKDRKEYISSLCEKYGLEYEIINAVNGRELSQEEYESFIDKAKMLKIHKRELGRGEIGCTLSHKKFYERIVEENLPYAVVLEDDAEFNQDLIEFLGSVDRFPKDLELLLLGHQRQVYTDDGFKINSPYSRRFSLSIGKIKIRRLVGRGNGTYGYFITQRGARKMLEHLKKIYLPIDAMTSNEKFVNTYAIFPTLVWVNKRFMQETSTQENIDMLRKRSLLQKNIKKYSTFLKFLLPSLKRLKEYE
ncbi:glycosyltransferase [Helicobacter valdiviensis]|uniref:Glycosyltransferase n=1 Tax=Helicobacter valdiviensis TaxID=1458358 RepID=A0A2W6MWV1_9HELI|nr:glycosyltransferase family 25 protein [Helicobacter valdiviensis]PZT48812.1 glycosyltransferase [Helicobacter valdiviensis]